MSTCQSRSSSWPSSIPASCPLRLCPRQVACGCSVMPRTQARHLFTHALSTVFPGRRCFGCRPLAPHRDIQEVVGATFRGRGAQAAQRGACASLLALPTRLRRPFRLRGGAQPRGSGRGVHAGTCPLNQISVLQDGKLPLFIVEVRVFCSGLPSQLLVLKSLDVINVRQRDAYGDIELRMGPKWDLTFSNSQLMS